MTGQRDTWAGQADELLLAQCALDTYRASGPGGQKRNKTSSAVRLRHRPSGLIVIAEESRSQHENRARAIRRLRRNLFLDLREPADLVRLASDPRLTPARNEVGRLVGRPRDQAYFPAAAVVLDALEAAAGAVRETAAAAGTTTANLIDFLQADGHVWQAVHRLRARHGRTPLRT